jgi:PII-like signaling protein
VTAALKLTTYFGERDRTDGRLVADAILDLYSAGGIQTSLVLRGAAGFGRIHHLRSDRLLALSGDLPVVSVAVDVPERIDAVLGQVLAIKRRGLITLERTRLLSGELAVHDLRSGVAGPNDLDSGAAGPRGVDSGVADPRDFASGAPGSETKLTVLLGRRDRAGRQPAFVAVCDLLHRHAVAGAAVLLGVDGTRHARRARARFFDRNQNVPMAVVAVGSRVAISGLLPELGRLVEDPPVVVVDDVRVCKRDGALLGRPHEPPETDRDGRAVWQRLTLYCSESATHDGRSLHLELIRRLAETGAAGATSLRGIWGFHGDHAPHGDRLLQIRRHVPVVTTVIDRPGQIARSFEVIDELTGRTGLVTSEIVPAMMAISHDQRIGGLELSRHPR